MTNSEFVSRVVNSIQALNKDSHISRRYILSVGRSKADFLIAQKMEEKKLFNEENLFRVVNCFELKPDNIIKCPLVEFRRCTSLMKSVQKLPKMPFGRFGSTIVSVTSIDGSEVFVPTTLTQYALYKKRPMAGLIQSNFYYIHDGYLYLPDSQVELVNIKLIPSDEDEVEEKSSCKECEGCKSVWDYEFICSDKFMEMVLQQTVQEVASIYARIPEDENPNLDSNQKSQTTQ